MMMESKDSELVVAFLEVDKGDATIILIPDGGAMLVDCGIGSASSVLNFIRQARVRSLNLVAITHSDVDHAGDVIEVLNNFQGRTESLAVIPDRERQADANSQKRYKILLQEIAQLYRKGVTPSIPYAGQSFKFGELTVSVLHPDVADSFEALSKNNRNDASVVLRLEYQGFRILLGADVQGQGWQWMKGRGTDLSADIFKYPHHGAWYDGDPSPNEVISLVNPSVVVISTNSHNQYDHPSEKTIQLLREHNGIKRFVCTQATKKCHYSLSTVIEKIRSLLATTEWQVQGNEACPCGGTILVRISKGKIDVFPTSAQHDLITNLFDSPLCKK